MIGQTMDSITLHDSHGFREQGSVIIHEDIIFQLHTLWENVYFLFFWMKTTLNFSLGKGTEGEYAKERIKNTVVTMHEHKSDGYKF